MLYDPKWENKPSLSGFHAFVVSKPADECYEWSNCYNCACAQYAKSIERFDEWMANFGGQVLSPIWKHLNALSLHHRTFRELARRVKMEMDLIAAD